MRRGRRGEGPTAGPCGRTDWAAPFTQGPSGALGPAQAHILMTEGGLALFGHGLHLAWAFPGGRLAGKHAAGG